MSRFIQTLSLFIAGIPLVAAKTAGAISTAPEDTIGAPKPNLEPVQLRPINHGMENLFAGHRSHSSHSSHASHASHASHYSGSSGGGSYYPPQPVAPSQNLAPSSGSPATTAPLPPTSTPQLNAAEKRKLQVMRVQIALVRLGLYSGAVNGEFSADTQESLKRFQMIKGLPSTGLMTTDTLNALGVMAVQ